MGLRNGKKMIYCYNYYNGYYFLPTGYSTWMMLWHKNADKMSTLDFLDGLGQMHSLVMPLLQKVCVCRQ